MNDEDHAKHFRMPKNKNFWESLLVVNDEGHAAHSSLMVNMVILWEYFWVVNVKDNAKPVSYTHLTLPTIYSV